MDTDAEAMAVSEKNPPYIPEGEVNYGKKWVCTHYIVVHLLGLLTIIGHTNLEKYYTNDSLRLITIVTTWITTIFGLASSTTAVYIMECRPRCRMVYVGCNVLLVLFWVVNLSGMILLVVTPFSLTCEGCWVGTGTGLRVTQLVYGCMLVAMVVEVIVSMVVIQVIVKYMQSMDFIKPSSALSFPHRWREMEIWI